MNTKQPSWIDVKKQINHFQHKQLIELVGDLYRFSIENKKFFHARFSLGEDPLESYKHIIQKSLHPSLEDDEILDIKSATDEVNKYSKAVDNLGGEAELMVFFVESGNNFTLDYGDIDQDFYSAMLDMYGSAIETVQELPISEQKPFIQRLCEIKNSASFIGWGYGDGLERLYNNAFRDEI